MEKIFAVSGSASGIGQAVVAALKSQGHTVITIDIRDADICADLATSSGRQQCTKTLSERAANGLDGLIPCAGVGGFIGLSSKVIDVNYRGSAELIEGALPLLKQRAGTVVVIGSNSMAMPNQDQPLIEALLAEDFEQAKARIREADIEPYPSAKTALCIWMRRKAVHWIKSGVRMNAIAPGLTETGMTATQRNASPELAEQLSIFASSTPIGYAAEPDMIADVILFLLSPQSRFICGEVLYADGGLAAVFRPEHV